MRPEDLLTYGFLKQFRSIKKWTLPVRDWGMILNQSIRRSDFNYL